MSKFGGANWDRYAECYDVLNELRPYQRMLDDVSTRLRDADSPVLDAGCGTGNLIARIKSRFTAALVGIDASQAMLGRARAKHASIPLLCADLGAKLPFENGQFGAVVCVNTFYALKRRAPALREFRRILKPRGALLIVTPKEGYENGLILKSHCESTRPDAYWSYMHATEEREQSLICEAIDDPNSVATFKELASYNRRIADERSFRFFSSSALERLVRANGFVDIRIETTYAGQNLLLTGKRSERKAGHGDHYNRSDNE